MATYWENSCSFGLRYVSWYKYLIVGLVFSHLGFWSGNLFLIAPFPDLCLLVPYYTVYTCICMQILFNIQSEDGNQISYAIMVFKMVTVLTNQHTSFGMFPFLLKGHLF